MIFSGAAKLPGNGPETLFEAANYWLKCLTEITHLLSNAAWNVTFDDVNLIFDSDDGWRFPTDEEYKQQKSNELWTGSWSRASPVLTRRTLQCAVQRGARRHSRPCRSERAAVPINLQTAP